MRPTCEANCNLQPDECTCQQLWIKEVSNCAWCIRRDLGLVLHMKKRWTSGQSVASVIGSDIHLCFVPTSGV